MTLSSESESDPDLHPRRPPPPLPPRPPHLFPSTLPQPHLGSSSSVHESIPAITQQPDSPSEELNQQNSHRPALVEMSPNRSILPSLPQRPIPKAPPPASGGTLTAATKSGLDPIPEVLTPTFAHPPSPGQSVDRISLHGSHVSESSPDDLKCDKRMSLSSVSGLSVSSEPSSSDGPAQCLREPESAEHDEAVAEIEDQEVSEFLRRASKHLQEVSVQGADSEVSPPEIPKLKDFGLVDGRLDQVDWLGFGFAYALARLERHCPKSLRCSSTPVQVSMGQIRAHAERCYVLASPEFWHFLLQGKLGDVLCWKDPHRTARYVVAYYALWVFDLIPSFILGYGFYLLIKRQLAPPPVSQLKQEAAQRRHLGQQAEALGDQEPIPEGTSSMAAIFSKGSSGSTAIFPGTGTSTRLSTTESLVQAAGNAASSHNPFPKMKDHMGLYTLSRGLYAHYGHSMQTLMEDFADLGEKIRNLYLWRRPAACRRSSAMIFVMLCYMMAISQKWLVKNFLGCLGIEIFFIYGFTQKYPQFRKLLNPLWFILYEIPTDAEFALQILQERGRMGKPVGSGKSLKKSLKQLDLHDKKSLRSLPSAQLGRTSEAEAEGEVSGRRRTESAPSSQAVSRNVLEPDNWKRWSLKAVDGGTGAVKLAKKLYGEGEKVVTKAKPSSSDSSRGVEGSPPPSVAAKTFAMLDGKAPGTLIVHRDEIWFEPMKGFRSRVSSMKKDGPEGSQTSSSLADVTKELTDSDESSSISGNSEKKKGLAVIVIKVTEIRGIKKTKKFGLGIVGGDGLELKLQSSKLIRFENIVNRDEFFQKLLSVSSLSERGLLALKSES